MPAEGRTRLGRSILHKPARNIHGCDCKVDSSNHSWKRSAFFDPMAHGIDSRTKEKEAGKRKGKVKGKGNETEKEKEKEKESERKGREERKERKGKEREEKAVVWSELSS